MFHLEGLKDYDNPTKENIEEEFLNLQNGQIKSLKLSGKKGWDRGTIQARRSLSNQDSFSIEYYFKNDNLFKPKKEFSFPETLNYFFKFLKSDLEISEVDDNFELHHTPKLQEIRTFPRFSGVGVIIFLAALIVPGILNQMNQKTGTHNFWPTIFSSLGVIGALFSGWFCLKYTPPMVESISVRIHMPSRVYYRRYFRIEVKDKENYSFPKIIFLNLVIFIVVFLCIILSVLILMLVFTGFQLMTNRSEFIENFSLIFK